MELKERKEINPQDMWDLSTLFESDAAFEEAMKQADEMIGSLGQYRGTLHDAQHIAAYLKTESEVERKISNLYSYGFLRKTEDTRNTKALNMYNRVCGKLAALQTAESFASPEILANSDAVLEAIVNDPCVEEYRFLLKNLIDQKQHMLSDREEAVLAAMSEVFNVPYEASGALRDADMTFADALDSEGNRHEVSQSGYIVLQNSDDRTLRKNAFDSYYDTYQKHINTLTTLFAGYVRQTGIEAKLRGYESVRNMRMDSDHIPVSVYDNLIDTVHERMDLMHRYVKLRKRLLKLDEVHYYDVYAPLVQGNEKTYSYDEAKDMVIDAVQPLGTEYVDRVRKAFEDRWVDVWPNRGKEGGAFSEGTYDSNPFIKMNFTGTLDSVSTLAHEMGHSQHTWLTNHTQPYQYSRYTMFVAEVASTVNENLLISRMLEKETDPYQRLVLLNQYMEGFKGTVYRQTMFAEFEKQAHALDEAGTPLTSDVLNELYEKLIREYFGEELVFDDAVKYEWARIPHFYYLFYVYVYATGYCSAAAIARSILDGKEGALEGYLEFLKMGSSAYPLDELAHAGVDLTTPEPIHTALDVFASVLDEAEKTAGELGL
ncbi:MAG: oligoendopeptidase F [Bulleidia sp.]